MINFKTTRDPVCFDIECYRNYFFVGIRTRDGKSVGYEFSDRTDFDRDRLRTILRKYTIVGFNSRDYDMMVLLGVLAGFTNSELKDLSDDIIKNRLKPWDTERKYGLTIPKYVDHVDLFDSNPSVGNGSDDDSEVENAFASGSASLKTLAGRMHCERLQDLPVEPDSILTHEQMDTLNDYCLNSDCVATWALYDNLSEPLALREEMGEVYDFDFRSLSDAQMGERMIKIGAERATGQRIQKGEFPGAHSFRYQVPDFIEFQTPLLRSVLKVIRETDIQVTATGSVKFPDEFKNFDITINGMAYKLGIGGLHSTEKCRAVLSDEFYQLVDWDVGSQYPSIILKLGLFPLAIGPIFRTVYGGLKDGRMKEKGLAKAAHKEGRFDDERMHKQRSDGLKVGLNGPYGKLGSRYSALYAPHLMIATTLTGQLTLLMMIERAEGMGIRIVSANTDGVVMMVPRHLYNGLDGDRPADGPLKDLIEWWEAKTSFGFEGAEYAAVYSRDVNYYMAIKPNGEVKRKGSIANHWHPDSPDYSVREMLKKSPNMTVCGDAIMNFLLHGTRIEDFINSYDDVRGFVRIIKAKGGGDWKGEYLGKTVRFYWGHDGAPIYRGKPHPKTGNRAKVSETDGCVPLMTLPVGYAVPADIDRQRYIDEAYSRLSKMGWRPEPSAHAPLEVLFNMLLNE